MVLAAFARRSSYYAAAIEKHSFNGQYSADSVIVTLSVALALYNSLEMILLIFTTFKRWKGLYFWSLGICNLGVISYAIGMMMGYFNLGVHWLGHSLLDVGWIIMIACQSLVLYSRLGLILDNPKILRAVKWMIITTSIIILPTTDILDFGTTYSGLSTFAAAYFYIEHIQMTVITLQELIISGLYVWKTIDLLKIISKANTRSMVRQLFAINVIIIAMDIGLVVLQYKKLQLYQESIKAFVYSVKLKLELNILSKLVNLVHGSAATRGMTLEIIDSNAIPGQAQAELRRELQEPEHLSRRLASNDKATFQHSEDGHVTQPRLGAQVGGRLDDNDGITPEISHQTRCTGRTVGRESDVLYADILRALK